MPIYLIWPKSFKQQNPIERNTFHIRYQIRLEFQFAAKWRRDDRMSEMTGRERERVSHAHSKLGGKILKYNSYGFHYLKFLCGDQTDLMLTGHIRSLSKINHSQQQCRRRRITSSSCTSLQTSFPFALHFFSLLISISHFIVYHEKWREYHEKWREYLICNNIRWEMTI